MRETTIYDRARALLWLAGGYRLINPEPIDAFAVVELSEEEEDAAPTQGDE